MTPGPDLRLVPAVLVAAVTAGVVVVLPVVVALAVALTAGAGALVISVAAQRHRPTPARPAPARPAGAPPGPGTPGRGARVMGQVVLMMWIATAVLGAGAAQVSARAAGGLGALADARATVRLVGTVQSDPVALAGNWPGAASRYRVCLGVVSVGARGRTARAAAPVVVLGGAGWQDVGYGTTVVADGRLAALPHGERAVALLEASSPPVVVARPNGVLRGTARIRSGLVAISAAQPGDPGGLLPGVAVGDTSTIPQDLVAAMRVAGLTHLTAVSGAHFALVGAAVLAGASAVRCPRPVRAAVVVVALAGFVALVRPGPSVLRAAAMGVVGVAGLVVGRPARAVPALCGGVTVLLVVDPWLIRDVGFVLSAVSTSGLVLLAGPLAARWAGAVGRPVAYALAAPIAAQCVCAPVVLMLNPAVATYAVPANLLADPAVAPATVLGLLAALVAPWWPSGATALAALAGAACWWIARVARVTAALPGAQLAWTGGVRGAVVLAVGTIGVVGLLLDVRTRRTCSSAVHGTLGACLLRRVQRAARRAATVRRDRLPPDSRGTRRGSDRSCWCPVPRSSSPIALSIVWSSLRASVTRRSR